MKKDGEHSVVQVGVAHVLFIFFILYVIGVFMFFPQFFGPEITGHAVSDVTEAKSTIEKTLSSSALFKQIPSADICMQIAHDKGIESIKVKKTSLGITATSAEGYCDGLDNEDIVVKFVSYEAFQEVMDSFSIATLLTGKGGDKFYILESKLVREGGDVKCDADFKTRFCGAVSLLGTPEDLINGDLSCCFETITPEQAIAITEHEAKTGFTTEIRPIEETPSSSFGSFLFSPIFLALMGGLVILSGVIIALTGKKKPKLPKQPVPPPRVDPHVGQLRMFVRSKLEEGYSQEQVHQYLQQQGWNADILSKVFSPVKSQ